MKKYEFTGEKLSFYQRELHRIRAVQDFGNVKAGALGGWIESEQNLSHDGICWVADNAMVMDLARVNENAIVRDDAKVAVHAVICGNAIVEGHARVYDAAMVAENALVGGEDLILKGSPLIGGNAQLLQQSDILWLVDIGSRQYMLTFFRCTDNEICMTATSGLAQYCFTLEEFLNTPCLVKNSFDMQEFRLAVELAKAHIRCN